MYLYLFALVGLALVVMGSVRLLDLGLKIFIFKEADKPESVRSVPPYPPYGVEPAQPVNKGGMSDALKVPDKSERMSVEEKNALSRWVTDYNNWRESQKNINYLRASREREASNSLAFIIIGLPLYLYHWFVITRERKREA